jgi:hypothetical protein
MAAEGGMVPRSGLLKFMYRSSRHQAEKREKWAFLIECRSLTH